MPIHELAARTARLQRQPAPARVNEGTPAVAPTEPRRSLKGLDLATLAAPPAPSSSTSGTQAARIDPARLASVSAAVASVAAQPSTIAARPQTQTPAKASTAPAHFAALGKAIDAIGDLEVRQRAFLRVLETFGSEWTPDATSRAIWGGGAGAVVELKKRGLWEPWETPRGQSKLQLTPDEQTRFIDEVLAPSWTKLIADTAAAAAAPSQSESEPFDAKLAQQVRGLVDLQMLWATFAKSLWHSRKDAIALDDGALLALVDKARPADKLVVAAAVQQPRPEVAKALADGAVGAASLDDIGALLLAADKSAPLAPLRALVGERLAAAHPLDAWQRWVAEPPADDVKTTMMRIHGAALAVDYGKLDAPGPPGTPAPAVATMWTARVARFDTDEIETAAKVVGLAQSLAQTHRIGRGIIDETLATMPDATLVRLALLPPSKPPEPAKPVRTFMGVPQFSSSSKPYVEDPQTAIHNDAARHIGERRPDVLETLLTAPAPAAARREHLALALAFVEGHDAHRVSSRKPTIAAAAGAAVSALLSDPTTTDEPRPRPTAAATTTTTAPYKPSDTSLQKLLMGASALARVLDAPVALDAAALAPLLPKRGSEELLALLEPVQSARASYRPDARVWSGDAAAAVVREELRSRFAASTLEPHDALLAGAFKDAPPTAPDRAALSSWLAAQRAQGAKEHAAALVAVAKAFGPELSDANAPGFARKDVVEGALLASFGELVDDAVARASKPGQPALDDKQVRELFGLAHAVEQAMPHEFAPKLSTVVAQKVPLDVVSAPFLDDKLGHAMQMALPQAHKAAKARIVALEPREAAAFFAGAGDAKELTRRLSIALGAWCSVGKYDKPLAQNAQALMEQALPAALERLARSGDVNDADQRKLVLFAGHALREKLGAGVAVDVAAGSARRFTDAAPARDVIALCLDGAAGPGLRAAAIESVERRAQTSANPAPLRELLEAFLALSSGTSSSSKDAAPPSNASEWRALVDEQLDALAGRPWNVLWGALDGALEKVHAGADIDTRARDVLALLPPSREQNQALARALGAPPLPFAALARINSYEIARNDDSVLRPERRLLAQAIVAHPDGPFAIINALDGKRPALDVPPALAQQWQKLAAPEQRDVVEDSFRRLFRAAYGDPWGGGRAPDATVKRKVDDALERAVFSTLRQDKDLAPLVDRLQPIFAGLPGKVQARVAAAFALEEPTTDPPAVLRRLLENAGVVAIKVAQQICEDPSVPQRFRDVLESLRDQNLEVGHLDAWSVVGAGGAVRGAQDAGYDALGKRLGTGSVKQANRVVKTAAPSQQPLVLAFLKPGVKEEIEQSLQALGRDKELAPVVDRVRSMLMRELDLDKEAGAFTTMAKHLAPWNFLRVPKVIAHGRESLVREMSPGTPVSEILRTRKLDDDEKRALQESYRALFAAALDPARFVDGYDTATGKPSKRGFVLTDPHQGNVALDRVGAAIKVDLFDPGQFETLNAREAELFVQLIVHLSASFWAPKRASLLDSFAQLIYDDAQRSQWQTTRNGAPSVDAVRTKLASAWDKAEKSLGKDKEPGAFLRAWLFAAADDGLNVPDAYFGVAKMLHTLDSQCKDLGLADVIREEVARLYKGQLSFKKAAGILGFKLGLG